jgi:hypothetical protein
MYRESNHACIGCGRWLAPHQCDYDFQGRPQCARCHARSEVDRALSRWREDARSERHLKRIAAAVVMALPAFLLLLALAAAIG